MKSAAPLREVTEPDRILAIADSFTEEKEAVDAGSRRTDSWLSFRAGGRLLALPVSHVRGIHRLGHLTPLPQAPRAVRGLINLRGRVIALADLAVLLGFDETATDTGCRVLDTEFGRRRIGLLVESGDNLLRIRAADVEPVPEDLAPSLADRAAGILEVPNDSVLLLDAERLWTEGGEREDDDS